MIEQMFLTHLRKARCRNAAGKGLGRYREQATMETKDSGRGEPVESMCLVAGTGSSVLDPFPSVVVASLRAVDHRCCTPLRLES